jgi:hypothetical protein
MSIYVAAGLGLLLTTSFLGLRRYLRQKKLQMPWKITAVWMATGAALIVVFLFCGALLPRPAAEYALVRLPWQADATDQDADKNAGRGDRGGKGDSRRGAAGKDDDAKKEQAGAKGKEVDAKKGDGKAKGPADKQKAQPDKQPADEAKAEDQQPPSSLMESISKLATWLNRIVVGAIVLVVMFVVGRALLTFLANFTAWADSLLKFLRSFWKGRASETMEANATVLERRPEPLPFAEFSDPFATGAAPRMSPEELVRYTFAALESWAAARELARKPGETPFEFAARIGAERPAMEECVRALANYYASLAYGSGSVPEACRGPMRQCWQQMSGSFERGTSTIDSSALAPRDDANNFVSAQPSDRVKELIRRGPFAACSGSNSRRE